MNLLLPGLCFSLLAPLAAMAATPARGTNLLVDGGFEAAAAWSPVGGGFELDRTVARSGSGSLRCSAGSTDSALGARQTITFDPPVKHPLRIGGWSRASSADVLQDYSVYLDLQYEDGTPLWGQIATFNAGSHDWEYAELVCDVAKPVRSIQVHVLFRKARGTVWFDDIKVELAPLEFRNLRVLPGLFGGASLAVAGGTTLPAKWEAMLLGASGVIAAQSGSQAPVSFAWAQTQPATGPLTLRLSATDDLRNETLRWERPVVAGTAPASRGYAVWTESSMQRVLPHMLPAAVVCPPRAAIALAGNEYESFQVVLLAAPGLELGEVRVAVSDLVCQRTGQRIPASRIEWRQVGFVRLEKLWQHPRYPEAEPGWWPDPLLAVDHVHLRPLFAQPIWVTVYAPPGTPAGQYTGTLTVSPQAREPTQVDICATVHGFSLPTRGHLKTAFALMDGFLERVYGKPLPAGLRRRYGDFVLQHRLNPDDISRTDPPAVDDLLHYSQAGLNAFNVLNMVQERGAAAWVCFSEREVYTPPFKERLIQRLDPCVEGLRRAGLLDRAFIYTFDERGADFYPIIREYFGWVKQRYPGIRTLTTAQVPQDPVVMRDLNIDWNCPLTAGYRFEQAEKCRADGLEVWAYVCMGPRYPYANWLADDPLIEARVLGWQAFQQKLDGLLYWGLNIWDLPHNDRPIDPRGGPLLDWSITTGGVHDRLHGDGRLLYAGVDGPIGSIRLANIRDALEDYEYLWLLAEQAGSVETAREASLPVTCSLTSFTRDPAVLAAQREAVAARIKPATRRE